MTNHEAIGVLESINAKTDHIFINDDARSEAIEMAISALRAQNVPDTNVGDMISRQAAMDALLEEVRLVDGYYVENDEVINKDDAIEAIRLLPPAQPEPIKIEVDKLSQEDLERFRRTLANAPIVAMPSAQPEPCLDSIVSEIKKTISETQENGKYHCADIRINGEMICFGLQLALEIIEEKRNGQSDNQTGGD